MLVQEKTFERFTRGWAPLNRPPEHLYPRDLREGEVIDALGLRPSDGGQLRWQRNQFMIEKPSGGGAGQTKSLLEYRTDTKNQLLAFTAQEYATFGCITEGASEQNIEDRITGSLFTTTGGFYAKSMKCYLRPAGTGEHPHVKMALYKHSDLSLIGVTEAKEVSFEGWFELEFDPPAFHALEATTEYLFVAWTDEPTGRDCFLAYDAGDVDQGHYDAETYDGFPDPLVPTHEDREYSVHVKGYENPGRLYVMDTDWANLQEAVQGGLGYELFSEQSWSQVTSEAAAVALLRWWGIADAAQLGDILLILHASADAALEPLRYNGTTLKQIGFAAPTTKATGAEAVDGKLSQGTYSYFYCYDDGEFETMGSPIEDVHTTADGKKVDLSAIADAPSGTPNKNIYRAYTQDAGADARGDTFLYLATIGHGTTTYQDNHAWYELGEEAHYDRARPPWGSMIEFHKDRLFMAGVTKISADYGGTEGDFRNILFFSGLDEPYYWPAESQITVGDDTPITGLVSWHDQLVILKANSVWVLTGYDQDWQLTEISPTIGSVAQNAQAGGPPGVLWAAPGGYYFYDGSAPRRVLEAGPFSPWGQQPSNTVIPTMCFHNGKFYMMDRPEPGHRTEDDHWLEWDVAQDRWTCHRADFTDPDYYVVGLRAYNFGGQQAHVLTRMGWAVNAAQQITILDPAGNIEHADGTGTTFSDLHAPVEITLPPIEAPPGQEIVPLEVWVDGSWPEQVASGNPWWMLHPVNIPYIYQGHSIEDCIRGCWFTSDVATGYLWTIYAHIYPTAGISSFHAKAAIYSYPDYDLIASSADTVHNNAGTAFYPFQLTTHPQIFNGSNYAMVVWADDIGGENIWLSTWLLGGPSDRLVTDHQTYDGWPDPLVTTEPQAREAGIWGLMRAYDGGGEPPEEPPEEPGTQFPVTVGLFLNDTADYSHEAGDNSWEETPVLAAGHHVVGVPSGYDYGTGIRTNARKLLYVQLKSEFAPDFQLDRVGLRYYLRQARGE